MRPAFGILWLVLGLGLGGCAPGPSNTPATEAAGEEMRHIRAECEDLRKKGEIKTLESTESCANPRIVAAYQQAGYPYMDLIRFAAAARLAGAEKVDNGEISEAEYDRQRLVLRDRVADEIRHRNAEAAAPGQQSAALPSGAGALDPDTEARLVKGLPAFGDLR